MISHFYYLFSYSFYIIALKLLLLLVRRCKYTIFIPKELPLPLLDVDSSLFPITVFHLTGEFE